MPSKEKIELKFQNMLMTLIYVNNFTEFEDFQIKQEK